MNGSISAAACRLCAAGQYQAASAQGSCDACSPGQYQANAGQTSCFSCRPGFFSPNSSATQNPCAPCGAGQFQVNAGQSACNDCAPGRFNPSTGSSSASACRACAAGQYQIDSAQRSCIGCPVGRFAVGAGSVGAQPQTGDVSEARGQGLLLHDGFEYRTLTNIAGYDHTGLTCHGSDLWLPVPAGFEIAPDTADIITNVVAAHPWSTHVMVLGSLRAYGTAAQSNANAGQEYGDHQDKAVSRVLNGETEWSCPWSCYQILIRRPFGVGSSRWHRRSNEHCFNARYGSYSTRVEAAVACAADSGCYGVYDQSCDGNGTFHLCPSSTLESSAMGSCVYVMPRAVGEFCLDCPAGQTSSVGASSCTPIFCPAGEYLQGGNCTACQPGSFAPARNSNENCTRCPAGTHQARSGQPACDPCTAGHHQPNTGQTSCYSCSQGQFADSTGSSSCANCSTCQAGRYTVAPCTSLQNVACGLCEPGTYQSAQGASSCVVCAAGRFLAERGAASRGACTACASGRYQPLAGRETCRNCRAGRFGNGTGRAAESDCIPCNTGTYSPTEGNTLAGACIACVAGKWVDTVGSTNASD
eukprot:COSAG04_NODE_3876_length_2456_cov_2.353415_1_plen_584_part_10